MRMLLAVFVTVLACAVWPAFPAIAGVITIASAQDGHLVNFDSASGHQISILSENWEGNRGLLWARDGFLYGASDNAIIKYDPASGNSFTLIDSSGAGNPLAGVGGFDYGPDGLLWVSSRNNGNLIKYNPANGHQVSVVANNWEGNRRLLWGPDGFLYGASSAAIQKYDPGTGNSFTLIDSSGSLNPLSGVGGMSLGPDGFLWVASADNGNLLRYGPASGSLGSIVATNWEGNRGLLWAPNGYLYGASATTIVKYDSLNGNSFTLIDGSSGPISGVGGYSYVPEPAVGLLALSTLFFYRRRSSPSKRLN